jgi:hypothetical protein
MLKTVDGESTFDCTAVGTLAKEILRSEDVSEDFQSFVQACVKDGELDKLITVRRNTVIRTR